MRALAILPTLVVSGSMNNGEVIDVVREALIRSSDAAVILLDVCARWDEPLRNVAQSME